MAKDKKTLEENKAYISNHLKNEIMKNLLARAIAEEVKHNALIYNDCSMLDVVYSNLTNSEISQCSDFKLFAIIKDVKSNGIINNFELEVELYDDVMYIGTYKAIINKPFDLRPYVLDAELMATKYSSDIKMVDKEISVLGNEIVNKYFEILIPACFNVIMFDDKTLEKISRDFEKHFKAVYLENRTEKTETKKCEFEDKDQTKKVLKEIGDMIMGGFIPKSDSASFAVKGSISFDVDLTYTVTNNDDVNSKSMKGKAGISIDITAAGKVEE